MAVVPMCYTLHYKDSIFGNHNILGPNKIGCICFCSECNAISKNSASSPSGFRVLQPAASVCGRTKWRRGLSAVKEESWNEVMLRGHRNEGKVFVIKLESNHGSHLSCSVNCESHIQKLRDVWYASESSNKQLRSLASYFGRLQGGGRKQALDLLETEEVLDTGQLTAKKELELLDAYFEKVDKETAVDNYILPTFDEQHESELVLSSSSFENSEREDETMLLKHKNLGDVIHKGIPKTTDLQEEEISDLYSISVMISINIAVFLFEMASPVKNSDLELFSLPSLYGAKINHLILVGEWWRLVTPMFLHSGFPHVAFSCWALLTFGLQVCRGYGPFTFLLIYLLGGVSGNLTSFLHTPEPTVGGTGPVFAMIGAWLVYQFQNKDVIAKDVSDDMFLKAIIAAVISSLLTNTGPIDEWTHTGAAFTGMLYGFLTCQSLQVDDSSSRRGQENGIEPVRKYADPCKSLALFTLFIVGFCCLLFFSEPPPNTLEIYDF